MMQQQHHQQQVPHQAASHHQNAVLAAAAAASPAQFHASYHGAPGANTIYNQLANGAIVRKPPKKPLYPKKKTKFLQKFPLKQPLIQVTSANGQPTLVPLMTNGFHPSGLTLQPQPTAIYATDHTGLIQHVQAPNLAAAQNAMLPHQRTDRLTVFFKKIKILFQVKFKFKKFKIDPSLKSSRLRSI